MQNTYIKRITPERTKTLFKTKKRELLYKHLGKESAERFDGEFRIEDAVIFKKPVGRELRVLNITDTHFSDYDERFYTAFEVESTVRKLVKAVKPDLITVTGDLVCGKSTFYSIDRICDMFESFNVPWAPVFGNHDGEGNCTLDYLAERMIECPHCLMKKGDPRMGVGNYVLLITEDESENAQSCFVFCDSHRSQPNELQKEWGAAVCKTVNALTQGKAEISFLMHIPLPEYQYLYNEGYDAIHEKWRDETLGIGEWHEEVCCERGEYNAPVQRGFFDMLKKGGVKHVICGHEHMNDYSAVYDGIRLTYTLKIGYGSGWQWGFNGGTEILVDGGIRSIKHISKIHNRLKNINQIIL